MKIVFLLICFIIKEWMSFLVKSMELNRISGVGDVLGSKIFRFDEKDLIPQSKK